jgi:hypothetical protein
MRAGNLLVFDQRLSSASAVGWTADPLQDTLGTFDQLALMAVVDDVVGPGDSFKVQVFHSANGIRWLPKTGLAGDAEIGGPLGIVLTGGQTAYFGADRGRPSSLGLVRLQVSLGRSLGAHVRVWVTGRNLG